jgi:hypothetical protein
VHQEIKHFTIGELQKRLRKLGCKRHQIEKHLKPLRRKRAAFKHVTPQKAKRHYNLRQR